MARNYLLLLLLVLIAAFTQACLDNQSSNNNNSGTVSTVDTDTSDTGGASETEQVTARGRKPIEPSQSVSTLAQQRRDLERELETLSATPGFNAEELTGIQQQISDLDQELLKLAEEDEDGVMAALKTLADTDKELSAEWSHLVMNPTAAPTIPEGIDDLPLSGRSEIALLGEPYRGTPKMIEDLRGDLKEIWEVEFTTTFGNFTIEVYPELAPIHAVRFLELVEAGYYDNLHIHRIAPGWVIQWGDLYDRSNAENLRQGQEPPIYPQYKDKQKLIVNLKDEPANFFNSEWTVTFAKGGPNTASTQPFINLGDNSRLGQQGFSPFGYVTKGRENIEKLITAYTPAMEAGKAELRALLQEAGEPEPAIALRLQNDLEWGPYAAKHWNAFKDSMILKAEIVKRPHV
ncbi:peptidylprolyl isomerase [bacterium]|nr:peptidylprolyl isomerase [bacterium]